MAGYISVGGRPQLFAQLPSSETGFRQFLRLHRAMQQLESQLGQVWEPQGSEIALGIIHTLQLTGRFGDPAASPEPSPEPSPERPQQPLEPQEGDRWQLLEEPQQQQPLPESSPQRPEPAANAGWVGRLGSWVGQGLQWLQQQLSRPAIGVPLLLAGLGTALGLLLWGQAPAAAPAAPAPAPAAPPAVPPAPAPAASAASAGEKAKTDATDATGGFGGWWT